MTSTPVWQADAWNLDGDLAKIRQQWDYVRSLLEDPALARVRDPEISGWSCGEHAGHIALVTLWIADGIEQNLLDPSRDEGGRWTDVTEPILVAGDFPRGVAQSPAEVNPVGRPGEGFLAKLHQAEQAWGEIGAKADRLPECEARFPHFALGYMTSTEWVRFCALHTADHLAVVRDLRVGAR